MKVRSFLQMLASYIVIALSVLVAEWVPASAALLDPRDKPQDAVSTEFRDAVVGFLNYFLGFLGLVAVAFVIYAGVLMVTSQGEDDNTGKAKKILLYAGVGIIIVLLSWAIVRLFVNAGEAVA